MLVACGARSPGPGQCPGRTLGERRFPIIESQDFHVLLNGCQRIVLRLKPQKLGFQIPYAPLKTPHLRDHTGVGTADVAE